MSSARTSSASWASAFSGTALTSSGELMPGRMGSFVCMEGGCAAVAFMGSLKEVRVLRRRAARLRGGLGLGVRIEGLQFEVATRFSLDDLNFLFRFGELGLTDFHKFGAFLIVH